MKYVFQTQFMENYGAHDWDGKGECPQYWKYKGGETYVFEVSIEQAMSKEFYAECVDAICGGDEYYKEYLLGSELLDDIDYVEAKHVEKWEQPYYVKYLDGKFVFNKTTPNGEYGWMKKEIAKQFTTFTKVDGKQTDYATSFEMVNGDIIPYADLENRFEKYGEVA